jgi:hypothetical protein
MHEDSRPATVRRLDERLHSVNQKIAALAASQPCHDGYGIFSLSGQLARQAVDITLEQNKCPGVDAEQLLPVLNFWYRLSDYARTAARDILAVTSTEMLLPRSGMPI